MLYFLMQKQKYWNKVSSGELRSAQTAHIWGRCCKLLYVTWETAWVNYYMWLERPLGEVDISQLVAINFEILFFVT